MDPANSRPPAATPKEGEHKLEAGDLNAAFRRARRQAAAVPRAVRAHLTDDHRRPQPPAR